MTGPIHMTRRDPARNLARYYRIEVARTLFGGHVVLRLWGRIGSAGQSRICPAADEQDAARMVAALVAAKRRRGYLPSPP